ncbi:MAG: hypothetical protein V4574_12985 [Pseudomonadota bacterium]
MARILVLASFDRKDDPIVHQFQHRCDLMHEPATVTLGFRQVYRKCFSAAYYDRIEPLAFQWLNQSCRLHEIYYFESIGTSLSETEGDTFLLGFTLTVEKADDISFNKIRILSGLDEQGAIFSLIRALPPLIQRDLTDKLHHSLSLPGLASFELDEKYHAKGADAALMFSFFYFAKLLLWRIRRDQADINISLLQKNFREAIFLTAVQRSRIINIKRYQLTSNISNDPDIRSLANELKEGLNLQREYENDEELNTLVEEYLASLEKLFNEESRRRIERGVTVFSFVAVPFTVMATLLAMVALPEQLEVLQASLHRSVNLGIWFLLFISVAIPLIIYLAASLAARGDTMAARLATIRARTHTSRSPALKYLPRIRRSGTRSS